MHASLFFSLSGSGGGGRQWYVGAVVVSGLRPCMHAEENLYSDPTSRHLNSGLAPAVSTLKQASMGCYITRSALSRNLVYIVDTMYVL